MKTYVVGIHQKRLAEALLLCTHDIGFPGGIRKNIMRIPSYQERCKVLCDVFVRILIRFYPCHAEYIKMPRPLLIFCQSDYLIQVVDTNSYA